MTDRTEPANVARRYDGEPVTITVDKPRRPAHMIQSVRRQKWPEVFAKLDPDRVAASPPVPAHIASAFREVFGDDPTIKLALHWHWKRWCMFERVPDPETGSACWYMVSMFQEPAEDGWLPPDLDLPDKRHEPMRGRIGAFREPNRRDFELIARTDKTRHNETEILAELDRHREEDFREHERVLDEQTTEAIEYRFNEIKDAANQDAGSGQHMRSTPGRGHVGYDPEASAMREVEWNGVKTRFRRGSKFEAMYEAEIGARNAPPAIPTDAELARRIEAGRLQRAAAAAVTMQAVTRPKKTL